ncbi:MAG: YfhO family protein, partial [Streptomyces sp.]|nr:YfhO family protein [Streptomyces sp.]
MSRTYPFGPRTRNVNDLGNQFVPFHAHLWDLLHGRADGGILLNWQSGYGTSFLPDLGTYVSSPFALLVGLFPRDRIDLAVYVITVMKIGAAAAAMACLLLTLRPGRWWAAGLLGASYAMCGWTVATAEYNTMWLDGLIAFPLFCTVVEWARAGRRPVLSVVVVALGWTANFYTAYMATIAAAVVLAARLLMEPGTTRRQALAVTGRAALSTVLGIGLTAPLLLAIVKATEVAYPGRSGHFTPAPWADVSGRLLPGTFGSGSPALYLDSAALLLVLLMPFHTAVPRRTRAVWTGTVLVVLLSFQWQPTHLAWHAFATPNGSPYRQTFVLSGVMIIAAWFALAHGLPKLRPIVWGAGVMVVLAVGEAVGSDTGVTGLGTYPLFAVGLVVLAGALLLLGRAEAVRSRALVVAAVAALVGVQISQSALSTAWADRERIALLDDYAPWGARESSQAAAIASADAWPDYRTDPGREQTVGNDPLMVGGQGATYYSSLTPDVWTRTLSALGGGWTSHGRSL